MKHALPSLAAAGLAVLLASPALAQGAIQRDGTDAGGPANAVRPGNAASPITAPNATVPTVVNPGGPGVANSGPGATGTMRTEGTGAGSVSNNPAGAGNAQQPSRANSTPSGSGSR